MERCLREIAAIEAELLAGNPDVAGLCLALADWWTDFGSFRRTLGRVRQTLYRRLQQLEAANARAQERNHRPDCNEVARMYVEKAQIF
jgi:hypothetical protein